MFGSNTERVMWIFIYCIYNLFSQLKLQVRQIPVFSRQGIQPSHDMNQPEIGQGYGPLTRRFTFADLANIYDDYYEDQKEEAEEARRAAEEQAKLSVVNLLTSKITRQ